MATVDSLWVALCEEESGREVIPRNLWFESLMGSVNMPQVFSYLPRLDGMCLGATCFACGTLAECQLRLAIPVIESDPENAYLYRLWGPYHG